MTPKRLREKLRAGEPTIGSFVGLGSPAVAELLGHAGFDWIVIEAEHTPLGSSGIEQMIRAVDCTGAIPLVRVPQGRPDFIELALDAGAMGIVAPMVRTAAEAEQIVQVTRYPPKGIRSFGPLRAGRYGFGTADYFETADDVVVVLIIETHEAAADLRAIASVEGVDGLYLGPKDLALSLGLSPLEPSHPEVREIAQVAVTVGRELGVAIGEGADSPEAVIDHLARGVTMIGYGPDYRLLARGAAEGLRAYREHT